MGDYGVIDSWIWALFHPPRLSRGSKKTASVYTEQSSLLIHTDPRGNFTSLFTLTAPYGGFSEIDFLK